MAFSPPAAAALAWFLICGIAIALAATGRILKVFDKDNTE
jgi:hypothetical protein